MHATAAGRGGAHTYIHTCRFLLEVSVLLTWGVFYDNTSFETWPSTHTGDERPNGLLGLQRIYSPWPVCLYVYAYCNDNGGLNARPVRLGKEFHISPKTTDRLIVSKTTHRLNNPMTGRFHGLGMLHQKNDLFRKNEFVFSEGFWVISVEARHATHWNMEREI